MSAETEHRLEGLEPDNLLAFLALLGLLRTLETAGLRPRAQWAGVPLRPVLSLPEAMTREAVAERAAEGARELATDFSFLIDGARFLFTYDQLRHLITGNLALPPATARRRDLALAPFVAEGAKRVGTATQKSAFQRSPLDCLGRGKTDLAATLSDALELADSPTASDAVLRCVFTTWARRDDHRKALRWDMSDFRRHAYAAKAPTKDHARQEWGANLLAVLGSVALTSCATVTRRGIACLVIAARLEPGGDIAVSWPIWTLPASLTGIMAVLAHPELSEAEPDLRRLKSLGVSFVLRAQRMRGEYPVYSRGEAV